MSEFIKMTKEDETIEVHSSVVEDHKRLGWKVVESEPVQAEPVAQPAAKGKSAK
jgi:hypothetical protein